MTTANVHALVKQEVDTLPDGLAAEVLDFVLFLKQRHAEEQFLWQQVEASREYRSRNPDDIQTVTAEEWERLTQDLDRESE